MISSTQMRPGMVVKFNNDLFSVFSVAHRTPGNLRGFVQAKMRNLRSGTMIEHRFSSEDKVERENPREYSGRRLSGARVDSGSESDVLYFFLHLDPEPLPHARFQYSDDFAQFTRGAFSAVVNQVGVVASDVNIAMNQALRAD